MAFTEFYCDAATGANINAGDKTANGVVTSTNGDWGNAAANRFTAAAGTPFSGVSVGDFASVYLDGATTAVYIGRVTAVNSGGASLDISSTAKSGTAPTTGANGRSCTTGGAWKGPNGAEAFPIGFVQSTMMNGSSHPPRINFKSGTNYAITATMTTGNAGPIFWQGYTTTVGDFGKATIDGGSGAGFVMMSVNSVNNQFSDLIFANGGTASGTTDGVTVTSNENYFLRCVFHHIRRTGLLMSNLGGCVECEAYSTNLSGASSNAGINLRVSGIHGVRLHSHDNTGDPDCNGFGVDGGVVMYHCIAESNDGNGSFSTGDVTQTQYGNDFYNNGRSGMLLSNSAHMLFNIQNCNFLKNGRYAIENGSTFAYSGVRYNCAYGTGTQANTLGDIEDMEGVDILGTITYASDVTPWNDPANGDFRIILAAAKNTGRGTFTQTAASYTGTVSYPDVGAAQHTG